jgi:hypothetical protein
MAADDDHNDAVLLRALALHDKASALITKGHWARAAENFERAAAAAATLRAHGDDCLLVAFMQAAHASMLVAHSLPPAAGAASPAAARAARADALALVLRATSALERRRAAGTLLAPGVRTAEERFGALRCVPAAARASVPSTRELRRLSPVTPPPWACDPSTPLFGYEAYTKAAYAALRVLGAAAEARRLRSMNSRNAENESIDEGEKDALRAFAARALRLMATPGVVTCREVRFLSEAGLVSAVAGMAAEQRPVVFASAASAASCDGDTDLLGAEVRAAWEALLRSGVLSSRRIVRDGAAQLRELHAARLATQAAAAARGESMHACALPSCGAKEAHAAHFKRCAACKAACYCCREHQAAHWAAHKAACKAARAAAAAAT